MNVKDMETRAFRLHDGGFHCAEAVALAVMEGFNPDPADGFTRAATAFGGGVGRTHQELCGALAGGLIALGWLRGRTEMGANWDKTAELAAELRRRFEVEFGSTNCQAILDGFGEQKEEMKCKRLSGRTAGILGELLRKGS